MQVHRLSSPRSLRLALALAVTGTWVAPAALSAPYLPPQASSLAQLRAVSLSPVQVTYHAGFPASVLMEVPATGATPRERARRFLETYADLYLQDHPAVGLIYSQSGFTDEDGETVRFAQTYQDLPVFGAEIVVHVSSDAQGPQRVFRTVGRLFIPARTGSATPIEPAIDLTPEIPAGEAEAAARLALGVASAPVQGETLLLLYDPSLLDQPGLPRLAWRVGLAGTRAVQYLIDANDSAVLYQEYVEKTSSGLSEFDLDIVDAELSNADNTGCFLYDGTYIGDESGLGPGIAAAFPEAAVAWNAARDTYLMFHDSFGRHSYDDDDGDLLVAVNAHLGLGVNPNATASSCGIQFSNGWVANDVLAHEFGHLVIRETSDLLGSYTPGTLNESYSDTMGILVDAADWLLGESMTDPNLQLPIRDFQTPSSKNCRDSILPTFSPCPDRFSTRFILPPVVDSGGVHTNAGITNKAFFLMANGGTFNGRTVTGMGRTKMGKLAHRAFINLPCNAGFTALRNEVLGRAQFMFAMNQGITLQNICSVKNAFAAVEIGVGDANCDGVNDSSTDSDGDGILDDGDFSGVTTDDPCANGNTTSCDDNCISHPNPGQDDFDGDGDGDICDADDDADGVPDAIDNCPGYPGTTPDSDGDGLADCVDYDDDNDLVPDDGDGSGTAGDDPCLTFQILNCDDNCRFHHNTNQMDGNSDGKGDACDPDYDGDGFYGLEDNCTFVPNPGQEDADGDTLGDACDDCPNTYDWNLSYTLPVRGGTPEPYQPDTDGDGIPDTCDLLGFGSTGMLNNGRPYGAFNVVAPTGTVSVLDMNGAAGAGNRVRLPFPACETGDPAGVEANERIEIVLTGLHPGIRGWVEDGRGRMVGRFRTNSTGTAHGTRFRPRCHERYFMLFETLATFDGRESFTATATALVPTGDNPWTSTAPQFSDPPPLPPDEDGDGLWDASDTCPAHYDPTNADADRDQVGDACDATPGGPVTLVFSGVVTSYVDGILPPNFDGIAAGIPFTGRLTYDSTLPIDSTAYPVSRVYRQPPPIEPLELSIVVAGFKFSAGHGDGLEFAIENGGALGDWLVVSSGDIAEHPTTMEGVALILGDPSATAFPGLALPPTLDLADFGERSVVIDLGSGAPQGSTHMVLEITSMQPLFREPRLYWLDTGTHQIRRSELDGSNTVTLVTANNPIGFEVDPLGGRIYWTESAPNRIRRSALDGTGVAELATGIGVPHGIALDPPGGALIFADTTSPTKLSTLGVGGGTVAALVPTAPSRPLGVAVDAAAGKVYWTELGTVSRIRRANLDGSVPENLIDGSIAPLEEAPGIALDLTAGWMYWTDNRLRRISRATLDGGGQQLLIGSAALQNPTGIALDSSRGKFYWADATLDLIRRANLDGTLVETVLTGADGLSFPRDLFVDPGTDCQPPTAALSIDNMQQGHADLTLTITDTNGPGQVTGYNVYRSPKASLPLTSWPLIALNAPDEDTPRGVQWTDGSANPPPGGILYYKVVAYNSGCPVEGPQ